MVRHASALLAAALATGCFAPGDGREPDLEEIYFPVGLAMSPAGSRLYVANSDFDLKFNAGSLQSYDVGRLHDLLPVYCESDATCGGGSRCDLASNWCVADSGPHAGEPCGSRGERTLSERLLAPGRCNPIDPVDEGVLVDQVEIGAFATDVILRRDPGRRAARLFVPVRGDATLHWVDIDDDSDGRGGPPARDLECGQDGAGGRCDDRHRVGEDPDLENTRDLRMPPEPYAIDVDVQGEAIAVTHQADGAISLFVNDWAAGPRLEFVLSGQPLGGVGIASLPEPKIVDLDDVFYQPGFLATFRAEPQVRLYRYFSDEIASPARPFLQLASSVGIGTNSVGTDSRGITIDPSERLECEAGCEATHGHVPSAALRDCQRACAGLSLGVYVANRAPSSLLIGHTRTNSSETSSDDLPRFIDAVPLPLGPSRVVVGDILDEAGLPARRVFVVCFDSRAIYVIHPFTREVETIITTGRGPHALAVETATPASIDASGAVVKEGFTPRGLAYVGHFTDSYVGVIDLDRRHRRTYGTIVASLGTPQPPRASK